MEWVTVHKQVLLWSASKNDPYSSHLHISGVSVLPSAYILILITDDSVTQLHRPSPGSSPLAPGACTSPGSLGQGRLPLCMRWCAAFSRQPKTVTFLPFNTLRSMAWSWQNPTKSTCRSCRWAELVGPSCLFCFGLGCFFFGQAACRILVPQPGIHPRPSAVKVQSLSHWIAREFQFGLFGKYSFWVAHEKGKVYLVLCI